VLIPGGGVSIVARRTADVNALVATSLVEALLIDRTTHLLLSALVDVCTTTTIITLVETITITHLGLH